MLHNHSEICIPPESHFFLWLEDRYQKWDLSLLDDYLTDLFNSTKFETWFVDKEALKAFIWENKPETFAQLNSLVYYFYNKDVTKKIKYWGDKNKLWKNKLPVVKNYYPKAKFIHLIRDGRDVACSFKELGAKKMDSKYAPKLPTDISQIAERWSLNIATIHNFQMSLEPQQTITIRYEDLLQNTETELRKVCSFLSINFESGMLNYYQQDKKNIEPEEFYQWKEKISSPPDIDNMGKYKSQLSADEIKIFNHIAGEQLQQFNYKL